MTLFCTQKTALLLAYSDAATAYSEAVAELHDRSGTIPIHEYDGLARVAKERRAASENARLAMDAHVLQHGC